MLTKILIFAAVVIGVFVVARLGASSAFKPIGKRKNASPRKMKAEEMVRCGVCGSYFAKGTTCSCGETPTP